MKYIVGIQIRPLIWFFTPFKKVEGSSVKYYKYIFLCFELTIKVKP